MNAFVRAARRCGTWQMPCVILVVLFLGSQTGWAAPDDPIPRDDPQVMVREATDRLLLISQEARGYVEQDRERYYAAVSGVLGQVVDMEYFARGVMATYGSARLYRTLHTDAEREAFRARVQRFGVAIERVLLTKYADTLLSFEGERIEVAPAVRSPDDLGHASVRQTIYDAAGRPSVVQYSLHLDREGGGWLIYNVVVEGVNLGQIYRTQFAEAVEQHRGDTDYVVDHWIDLALSADKADATAPGPP